MTPTSPAQTLWFLAPGLVHLLGNAVFTVHGRARLLAVMPRDQPVSPEQLAQDVAALGEGADRLHSALQLLRWLTAEGNPAPVAVGELLRALIDAARVPLRDRGVALQLTPAPAAAADLVADEDPPRLEPVSACQAVVAACRAQANTLRGSPRAHMDLWWSQSRDRAEVRIGCRLRADGSGTPLAREASLCADALRAEFDEANARWETAEGGATLVLVVANVRATFRTP